MLIIQQLNKNMNVQLIIRTTRKPTSKSTALPPDPVDFPTTTKNKQISYIPAPAKTYSLSPSLIYKNYNYNKKYKNNNRNNYNQYKYNRKSNRCSSSRERRLRIEGKVLWKISSHISRCLANKIVRTNKANKQARRKSRVKINYQQKINNYSIKKERVFK